MIFQKIACYVTDRNARNSRVIRICLKSVTGFYEFTLSAAIGLLEVQRIYGKTRIRCNVIKSFDPAVQSLSSTPTTSWICLSVV